MARRGGTRWRMRSLRLCVSSESKLEQQQRPRLLDCHHLVRRLPVQELGLAQVRAPALALGLGLPQGRVRARRGTQWAPVVPVTRRPQRQH